MGRAQLPEGIIQELRNRIQLCENKKRDEKTNSWLHKKTRKIF